jgi:hypothetical protein
MLIFAMVPDEVRATRTGRDSSPIGFDKSILFGGLITKEIAKERDAKDVEVSVGIIYCLGHIICVLDVGIVSQFEMYRPTISSPHAIPADCFNVNSLRFHVANKERVYVADYASCRIINDKWNTIGFKGHRGSARGRAQACKSIHLMTYLASLTQRLSDGSDQCVLKMKMRQVQCSLCKRDRVHNNQQCNCSQTGKVTVRRLEECLVDPMVWSGKAKRIPNLLERWS